MKSEIHPKWYPEAVVKVNGEVVMTVGSTVPEMNVEIWSGTHPFFTGQQRLVDTEGQVERFYRRLQKSREILAEQENQELARSPEGMPVEAFNLPKRARVALQGEGLVTVADVLNRYLDSGDDGLLSVVGVGQKALIDIKKFLRAQSLIE